MNSFSNDVTYTSYDYDLFTDDSLDTSEMLDPLLIILMVWHLLCGKHLLLEK